MHDRRRVLMVSPLLPPAGGGAAHCTALVATWLVRLGLAESVVVASEGYPGEPEVEIREGGRVVFRRLFPYRTGRPVRDLRSYLDYARQQLLLWRLPRLVDGHGCGLVTLHAMLLHKPNVLRPAVARLKRGRDVRVVLDVRDPKAPPALLRAAAPFDAALCCAERILAQWAAAPAWRGRLHLAPVPIEAVRPTAGEVAAALARHGLARGRYVFNSSGASLEKGMDLLLEALRLHGEGGPAGGALPLALAGHRRDWGPPFERASREGRLRHLGVVPQAEVRALAAGAAAVVHPSRIDTPSRLALESLAAGAEVLLPREVPEFERAAPHRVCAGTPAALAAQIGALLEGRLAPVRYDLAAHEPSRAVAGLAPLFAPGAFAR